MRVLKKTTAILDQPARKTQVISLQDFRQSKVERVKPMTHAEQLDYLNSLDSEAFAMLYEIYKHDGNGLLRSYLQEKANSTPNKAPKRLKAMESDGVITHREVQERGPKMPPTWFYTKTGALSYQLLQEVASEKLKSPTDGQKSVSVRNFLDGIRASAWHEFIEVMLLFCVNDELSMRQVSEMTSQPPQTQHGRFRKLMASGLLKRVKKRGDTDEKLEFFYWLSPEVSNDEIVSLANEHGVPLPQELTPAEDMPQPSTESSKDKESSTTDLLVSKLPEFDQTWPQEVKESWFKAYQQLIDMAQK